MESTLQKYVKLRDQLIREQSEIQERLREINSVLGVGLATSTESRTVSSAPIVRKPGRRSGISLRDAVLQVIKNGPMTKEEILQQVKNLGYRFSTNNPSNSLGVILYGKNPKFKNQDGRFSLPQGGPSASATGAGGNGLVKPRRRTMSPEARARIAAAQRARWAKAKRK